MIVAGERLFREALCTVFRAEEGVEVVGEAGGGLDTSIAVIGELEPHVVLLDVSMAGDELVRTIRDKSPDARLLMLTGPMDESAVLKALRAGARGYVSKNATVSDLKKAVQAVHRGEVWVERRLITRLLDGESPADLQKADARRTKEGLTVREQEILRVLSAGGTNRDIAQALAISEKTVKTHLNNIFRKLHVTRRLQAVIYAIRLGLR